MLHWFKFLTEHININSGSMCVIGLPQISLSVLFAVAFKPKAICVHSLVFHV